MWYQWLPSMESVLEILLPVLYNSLLKEVRFSLQQFKSYNFVHAQFLCSILEILVPLDWMEQLCGCHGDHSVAQRLEASSLTTPSPTGELALMLQMLVPLLYLGKTPALLWLLISTQTLITTLQCQLVQYREWAMSVLPWLYPHSHQGVSVNEHIIMYNK